MSVNAQAALNASRKWQKRLRIMGVVVLALGLASAGAVYWVGAHSSEPSEDELLPGHTRAETRQMEILYGKMGLLTQKLSDHLKQPGTQAFLIVTVSILAAAGCFYLARLSDDDNEVR